MSMLKAATMGEGGWIKGEIVGHVAAAPPRDTAGAHGWYIAYVGGLTGAVVARLKRRGWDSYVPVAVRFIAAKGTRGTKAGKGRQRGRLRADRTKAALKRIEVPVYPGYVFVAARSDEPEAWDIARVEGIAYLVHMADGDVVRLPNAVIDVVRQRAARSETIREKVDKLLIPQVGTAVRVIDGPFIGFGGRVEECDGERVNVGVEIFGRTTPVALDLDQVAILA